VAEGHEWYFVGRGITGFFPMFRKFERKGWVSRVKCGESMREKRKPFKKVERKGWVSQVECAEFVREK